MGLRPRNVLATVDGTPYGKYSQPGWMFRRTVPPELHRQTRDSGQKSRSVMPFVGLSAQLGPTPFGYYPPG